MNFQWQSLLAQYQALSVREQVLLGITLAALSAFGLQLSVIDPLGAKQDLANRELIASRALADGFQRQLGRKENQEEKNKSDRLKVEINLLQNQIVRLNEAILQYSAVMVPAHEMPNLLQIVLAKKDLQLVSLINIDPVPIIALPEDANKTEKNQLKDIQLYRHGISIKLRGEYGAVMDYIKELENQEWKFNWRSMSFEVSEYPIGELQLHLQTLSQDERWLGV